MSGRGLSASDCSLVQRSPTACDMSEGDRETSKMRKSWPVEGSAPWKIYIQGPPKECIHTLTKENSTLYNRLL